MKTLFRYRDYRVYLRDYYLWTKELRPGFSQATFAKTVGLASANHLNMVLSGKRNLTVPHIHRFGKGPSLGETELSYFEALVHFNQAELPAERAFYERRLRKIRDLMPKNGVQLPEREPYSRWFHPPLLIYHYQKKAPLDLRPLAKGLGVKIEELVEGQKILMDRGLVKVDESTGIYQLCFDHVVFRDRGSKNNTQKAFMRENLDRSRLALEQAYEKGARFNAHTFTVSKEHYGSYSARLDAFIAQLIAEADTEAAEQIVQINTQFFAYEGI